MTGGRRCPDCRGPLDEGVVEGLCPRCLLGLGLETPAGQPSGALAPDRPEWHVVALLGSGPHGRSYMATRKYPEPRLAVIKVIDVPGEVSRHPSHPLPLLLSVVHHHLAAILGGGTTLHGAPYLVSEYVAGISLAGAAAFLSRPLADRLRAAGQVAQAVACLHSQGLAHGNVSPANVIIRRRDPPDACLTHPGAAALAGRATSMAEDVAALRRIVRTILPELPPFEHDTASAGDMASRILEHVGTRAG